MKEKIDVKVFIDKNAKLPSLGTPESAGYDLYPVEEYIINPRETKLIKTNLFVEIPPGYECQIRPRSGNALKYGITVLNSPGTIDSDYRYGIGVILINHSAEPFQVTPEKAIAQAVFNKIEHVNWIKVDSRNDLSDTERNIGGFGHTDKK